MFDLKDDKMCIGEKLNIHERFGFVEENSTGRL